MGSLPPFIKAYDRISAKRMEDAERYRLAAREPRVGLYWFLPGKAENSYTIVDFSEPLSEVPEHAGFKDTGETHYKLWGFVRKLRPEFKDGQYEDYPRGRVTYYAPDRVFTLLLPRAWNNSSVVRNIKSVFNLTASGLNVHVDDRDPHYNGKTRFVYKAGMTYERT